MSFTEFCCRSGGSNLNAGTRTGSSTEPGTSADLTYASGTWVAGTGVFTVASGDPVADGLAVGDFASVYADGSSVTGFVGRVTARTSTTITVSLSSKMGTAPADGTSNRTVKIGGAWQGPNGTSGFPFNINTAALKNAAADTCRINLKNHATYSVTANITDGGSTTATAFEGYTTAYGDGGRATIAGPSTGSAFVLFQCGSVSCTYKGFIFDSNGATGSSDLVSASGGTWISCVAKNGRGNGFISTGVAQFHECESFANNASNTANKGGFACSGTLARFSRCISHDNTGSNTRGFYYGGGYVSYKHCIADTNGQDGFNLGGNLGLFSMVGCDSYNNTGNGLTITSSTCGIWVDSCNFVKNGGYGISASGTGQTGCITNCGFGAGTQANTNGTTTGLVGLPLLGSVNYASNVTPWTDPANGDFRISLAAAQAAGRGTFTQTASSYSGTVGYPDIGAAQSTGSGGGGGMIGGGNLSGGFQ